MNNISLNSVIIIIPYLVYIYINQNYYTLLALLFRILLPLVFLNFLLTPLPLEEDALT
jgi:hypothetical protein